MQTCSRCEISKEDNEFSLWKRICKSCDNEYVSNYCKARRLGLIQKKDKKVYELTGNLKTCLTCEVEKDEGYFELRADSGKRRGSCRDCKQKYVNDYRRKRWNHELEKIEVPEIVDGKKKCVSCNEIVPIDQYMKREDSKNGYRNQCNSCRQAGYLQWLLSSEDIFTSNLLRHRILYDFKNLTTAKSTLMGASMTLIKDWISYQFEDDMSWDNWGELWEIDHILPICKFKTTDEKEKDICMNWKNLQPLYKSENRSKGGRIHPHYFWNSVVSLNRFISFYSLPIEEYQDIRESICWLRNALS